MCINKYVSTKEQVLDSAPGKGQSWLYVETGQWDAGEQPHRKRTGSVDCQQAKHEPAVHLGIQEGQLYPGIHQEQHFQLVKGKDCPTLFCSDAALAWVLCAVLGAKVHERYKEEGKQSW